MNKTSFASEVEAVIIEEYNEKICVERLRQFIIPSPLLVIDGKLMILIEMRAQCIEFERREVRI